MIKTIQWYAYLWLNMLAPRFNMLWLRIQHKTAEREKSAHRAARKWARSALIANGSEIHVTGAGNIPESGGVLFVSNHQSNFDIPILIGFIPRDKGFIAKIELMKVPVFHMWMKALGCVFINRKDARQSLLALNQAAERLKEGYSLVIFPEGTRSSDGKLGRFKAGSLKLALHAKVPIVPVTITGSMNIMPKGSSLIQSARVDVIVSEPIFTDQLKEADIHAITDKVRNIIDLNLPK